MKKILVIFLTLTIVLSASVSFGCFVKKEQRTSYEIACTFEKNVLTGSETVTFYNDSENAFEELKFNLYGNAFRDGAKYSPIARQYSAKAYYNGKNYGETNVSSVKCGETALEYKIGGEDKNILIVSLTDAVYPEESVAVTIDFTLKLAEVVARTGINRDAVNLANFYPILCGIEDGAFYECLYYANGDPFFSDCADYKITLTCDDKYTVASSGKTIDSKTLNGKRTATSELKNARNFAMVLSDKFETVCDVSTGTEITYYYYDDVTPEKSLKAATDAIKYYVSVFGEFPYPTYSVVQTEFIQGGMEFASLVMISDALEERASAEVIVHETAHQWWQSAVGNNEIRYGFLDEGLAEYSVVMFYEQYPEYGYTREALIGSAEKTYKLFCSVYDKVFGGVDTTMSRSLGEYSSEYEYVNISYIKPCIMYDCLRKTVGDEKFFSCLKKYYEEYRYKNASPDDLIGVFIKQGADAESFFDSFINGKVIL